MAERRGGKIPPMNVSVWTRTNYRQIKLATKSLFSFSNSFHLIFAFFVIFQKDFRVWFGLYTWCGCVRMYKLEYVFIMFVWVHECVLFRRFSVVFTVNARTHPYTHRLDFGCIVDFLVQLYHTSTVVVVVFLLFFLCFGSVCMCACVFGCCVSVWVHRHTHTSRTQHGRVAHCFVRSLCLSIVVVVWRFGCVRAPFQIRFVRLWECVLLLHCYSARSVIPFWL